LQSVYDMEVVRHRDKFTVTVHGENGHRGGCVRPAVRPSACFNSETAEHILIKLVLESTNILKETLIFIRIGPIYDQSLLN